MSRHATTQHFDKLSTSQKPRNLETQKHRNLETKNIETIMNYLSPSTPLPKITGSLISYFSNMVKLNGGTNLAQGIPGFRPPEKLLEIFSQILQQDIHQYAPGCGNKKLLTLQVAETKNYLNTLTQNTANVLLRREYSYRAERPKPYR